MSDWAQFSETVCLWVGLDPVRNQVEIWNNRAERLSSSWLAVTHVISQREKVDVPRSSFTLYFLQDSGAVDEVEYFYDGLDSLLAFAKRATGVEQEQWLAVSVTVPDVQAEWGTWEELLPVETVRSAWQRQSRGP